MEHSKTAIADCLIDNDRVRVTQYRFSPGSETKWHLHEWDYIVIPQTDGELLLVDAEGQEQNATLTQGVPYYRCLLYTSPSPRDLSTSRMPSSA